MHAACVRMPRGPILMKTKQIDNFTLIFPVIDGWSDPDNYLSFLTRQNYVIAKSDGKLSRKEKPVRPITVKCRTTECVLCVCGQWTFVFQSTVFPEK